jgi:hypothetical protein
VSDQYHIDLKKYRLQDFKYNLQSRELVPSRRVLKINLDEKFQILAENGITNQKELIDTLKTKQKREQFATKTGLTVEYLTLLNREAKSYLPNPVRLDKVPGVASEHCQKLESLGIKNSRHLINAAANKADREQLSQTTGIPIEPLAELAGLSDLARVYGVGPVFARLIYDVGVKSLREFVRFTAKDFIEIYEEQTSKKADFGLSEIEFSLELAKELEIIVEF